VKVLIFYLAKLVNNLSHKKSTEIISLFSITHIDIGFLGFDLVTRMIMVLEK